MKQLYFILMLCLTGCATIISGSVTDVSIKHDGKTAATIYDSHNEVVYKGTIPTTVTLHNGDGYFRSARYTVKAFDNGNQTHYSIIDSSLNRWYFGNILLGGIIGMGIVDPFTGAMWTLPDTVEIK